jgi:hypothetical protein
VAIERIELPATTARDISSRSDNDSANLERQARSADATFGYEHPLNLPMRLEMIQKLFS